MNQHQVKVLSNLRPETVVAVKGVPFAIRALALPGVEDARTSHSEVAYAGAADVDDPIDVAALLRMKVDTEERMVVMDRFVVAGGLCFDEDDAHCNPLADGHANGRIHHRGRRARRDEESSFFEALGRDSDGNKALTDERVADQLVAHVVSSIRKNRPVMTTLSNLRRGRGKAASWDAVLKTIADAVHREGWEFALDYVAEWFLDVPRWAELEPGWRDKLADLAQLLCEREAQAAWERALVAGSIGHPLAVLLDIYEHGGVVYSVTGSGMQCRWDTTRGGAVWVPDEGAEDHIRRNVLRGLGVGDAGSKDDPLAARDSFDGVNTWTGAYAARSRAMAGMVEAAGVSIGPPELGRLLAEEAERYCCGVLEDYNAWVNGEVYGVVVYVLDRATGRRIKAHDHESWGYLGSEHAEDSLEEAVLSAVMRLGAARH